RCPNSRLRSNSPGSHRSRERRTRHRTVPRRRPSLTRTAASAAHTTAPRHEPVSAPHAASYGAGHAAARLTERLRTLDPAPVHAEPGERPRLSPPLTGGRDRIDGPAAGGARGGLAGR